MARGFLALLVLGALACGDPEDSEAGRLPDAMVSKPSDRDAAIDDEADAEAELRDASSPQRDATTESEPDASKPVQASFIAGVNIHDYPKPTAYGFTEADGADRMGEALLALGVTHVRAVAIGEVEFLSRLTSFGITQAVLILDPKSLGKPFDSAKLKAALAKSVAEATRVGLEVQVEGLNEWDLFHSKSYNDGVVPVSMSEADFVLLTQKALYEAAHPLGIPVLGPSVGHPQDESAYDYFPDVSAYVDIVNMHLYFGTDPAKLPIAERVQKHAAFQGENKPVWVTETGVSAYGGVSEAKQAEVIATGFATFEQSGLIDAAFNYELLDNQKPGLLGSTFTPESAEYHFGLFRYEGDAKAAAESLKQFLKTH